MKNKIIFLGVIVLITIIGISFSGCNSDTPPTVSISGTPVVGETIYASSMGSNFSTSPYGWQISYYRSPFSATGNVNIIPRPGAQDSVLLTVDHVGMYIRAYRNTNEPRTIYSNIIGPIQAAP
jgi:hypothetical protein